MSQLLNLLSLLLLLAILPASIAIKCIVQPDPEEIRKVNKEIRAIPGSIMAGKLWKDASHRAKTISTKVDCAKDARQHKISVEATHCFSIDQGSCPKIMTSFRNSFGYSAEGLYAKSCLMDKFITYQIESAEPFTPENFCRIANESAGCTRCYVCNDDDFCNEGPEKKVKTSTTTLKATTTTTTVKATTTTSTLKATTSTMKQTSTTVGSEGEESTEKTVEKSGAMLATVGPVSALFLVLVAIAFGPFRLAIFR